MLRKTRIILAALFFIGLTLLFVGIGQQWWGWMAKLQFLPSCLALNVAVIVGITLITILLGRLYCSVICPMGVFQDVVILIRRRAGLLAHRINVKRAVKNTEKKKAGKEVDPTSTLKMEVKHFEFSPERKIVRYIVLGVFVVAFVTSMQVLVAAIAPYSAYGRIVRSIVGLVEGQSIAPVLLVTAGITFVAITLSAWFWGRAYCSNICPVGTVLSLFSRFALFRIKIDADKCKDCGRCGRGCKASCIDMVNHSVDYSRCVDCFDCIRRCKEGAVSFSFAYGNKGTKSPANDSFDKGRRQFILTTALLGGAAIKAKAQEKHLDGGLAEVTPKATPTRSERLVPFGAGSVKNFYDHCTACQLCVSACPNGVLRPSTDLEHLLQPQMGYEKGYCRPECTECSQVCPAGAILPIAKEEKLITHIGTAKVNLDLCVSANGTSACGNCSRHCPVGAIMMVRNSEGRMVPTVAEEVCIGCGACEYLCPSRPISAITVNGLSVHHG